MRREYVQNKSTTPDIVESSIYLFVSFSRESRKFSRSVSGISSGIFSVFLLSSRHIWMFSCGFFFNLFQYGWKGFAKASSDFCKKNIYYWLYRYIDIYLQANEKRMYHVQISSTSVIRILYHYSIIVPFHE